jgi:hypothetical protein
MGEPHTLVKTKGGVKVNPYYLDQWVVYLHQRMVALEKELATVKKELSEVKPIHIENINYKVQELNIKELSGTLTVGIGARASEETVGNFIRDLSHHSRSNLSVGGEEEEAISGAFKSPANSND